MRLVVGIILVALLMVALIGYLILMLNAHSMVYCGDVVNTGGTSTMVTRVYTTDLSADETLSEIVLTMNEGEGTQLTEEQLTLILAEYQNIIYAPVFLLDTQQIDTNTYMITGSVYNGINEDGEPEQADYVYKDLRLDVGIGNGSIVMAENIYPDDEEDDDDEVVLEERKFTIDPVIYEDNNTAAFAFSDWQSFRMIVKATDANFAPEMNFVYTYNVVAENPLDFTGVENGALVIGMKIAYDEDGRLAPQYETIKTTVIEAED